MTHRRARVQRINAKRPPYRVEDVVSDRHVKDAERLLVKRETALLEAYTERKINLRELDKNLRALRRERRALAKLHAVSWATLRKLIIKRDKGRCAKCADSENLHVHHKIEKLEGGTDDPKNLITLCASCHMEWTHCPPLDVSFRDWLKTPPARIVTAALANKQAWTDGNTARDVYALLTWAFNDLVERRKRAA